MCRRNRIWLTDQQLETLGRFYSSLREWNEKVNLISRKDADNFWINHVLGSIWFLSRFRFQDGARILDLGTGGGLPGIPLAILCHQNQFVLVDSIRKKVQAVTEILSGLQLDNIRALCGRAEEISKMENHHHVYEHVIARAVAPMKDLIKWGKPFLVENPEKAMLSHSTGGLPCIPTGTIVLLKGGDLSREIDEATMKTKPKNISVHSIVINGISEQELEDKKLVIIQP